MIQTFNYKLRTLTTYLVDFKLSVELEVLNSNLLEDLNLLLFTELFLGLV